jgi:hypothetical protein
MSREHTPRAAELAALILEAATLLRREPTPENARAWLALRLERARFVANASAIERVDKLERLERDDVYCQRLAALQRATNDLVDRRISLVGYGATK